MKLIFAALLLCLATKSASAQVQEKGSTSLRLYRACQAFIRMVDAAPGSHPDNTYDEEYCAGYFKGFLDALSLGAPSSICLANTHIGTLVRVYVAYMEKTPKQLDDPEYLGVVFALHDAYACPAKN